VADILLLPHPPRQPLAHPEIVQLEPLEAEQLQAIRAHPEVQEVAVLMAIRAIRVVVVAHQHLTGLELLHLNNLSPIQWVLAAVLRDKSYLTGASNEDSVHIYNL
jgi:hypothetical protein